MVETTSRPDVMDVVTGIVLIVIGIPLSMSLFLIFLGAPMVMAGVELLTTRSR